MPSSIALGNEANVSDWYGIAIGYLANVSSVSSIALGPSANNRSYDAIAIGRSANISVATARSSIALGNEANVSGACSIALGNYANARGWDCIAIGRGANVLGECYSIALGTGANVSQYGAHDAIAIGHSANARAPYSVALGYGAIAVGTNEIVLGNGTSNVFIPGKLILAKLPSIPSDRRLKNVGDKYEYGLDKVFKIQPYNYTFKKDKNKSPRVGVMAQDLQKIFPDAVEKDDNSGYLYIRTEDMFYAMINSIKQLDKIVQKITEDVKSIFTKIKQIDDKIIALVKFEQNTNKRIQALENKNKQLEERLNKIERIVKNQRCPRNLGYEKILPLVKSINSTAS